MRRRDVLALLGLGAGALAFRPRQSSADTTESEYFIFIHAGGGWDVTLWADPRNERRGLVEPGSTLNLDISGMTRWKTAAGGSFELLPTATSPVGPALGQLYDLRDRLTVINGIAMNTVSHEDGAAYSTTGRHRTGGALAESSIDVLLANELGTSQRMPLVSVRFPSAFVGERLDRRVVPLRVANADAITRTFARSPTFLTADDRRAISNVLVEESRDLALSSTHPAVFEQLASQHQDLPSLLSGDFTRAFDSRQLQAAYPQFDYRGLQGADTVTAAFALEAIKRDLVRCVGFGISGFDNHDSSYKFHAQRLQELFNMIAALVKLLDTTPHPTRSDRKLADHTHILVVSDFCRTPQVNPTGGRDHYPNNSALVISPRFRPGVFGRTDPEQLLPLDKFTPPDILATMLGAFGIDPRRYMRDGEVSRDLLR